jgi:DNA-binding NarL/FixJ family response regulator
MSPQYRSRVFNAAGNAGVCDRNEASSEQLNLEVRKLLDDAYQLARRTLMADRDKLEGIVKGLLEHETFDSSQIKEIVKRGRLNLSPGGAPRPGRKMLAEDPLGSLGLTPREAEVLSWIAQGKSNYEIGVIVKACTGTICKHVEHILAKLSVENRTAAAAIAIVALADTKK